MAKAKCPECDNEVDLEKADECSKCGLDVRVTLGRYRVEKAVKKLHAQDEAEAAKTASPAKKKGYFD
jgi:hypothetical protein